MGRLFAKFMIGGIAGLLAWMICEPAAPRSVTGGGWENWEGIFSLTLGAFIGLAVGGLDGFTRGGKRHTAMGLGLGLVFGAIGMTFGHSLGGALAHAVFGNSIFVQNYNVLAQIPARVLALTPMGICLGAAIGGSSLTMKRTIQGAIGGGIGAGIAAALFDIVSSVLGSTILTARGQTQGEVGTPARAIFAILMGAGIGLFIGLVERFSRSAWLRLSLGRNEGKEWSIDTAQTFIGRSEGAHVPLFGDANVAPIHASIQKQGGNFIITDGGSPMGTFVNGQRIQQAMLAHGSVIQIGSFSLQFLLKGQPAPAYGPEAYRGQGFPMAGGPYPGAAAPAPSPYPAGPGGMPTQMMPNQPMPGQPMPGQPTQMMPGGPMPGAPMGGAPTQVMPGYPAPMPMGAPTQVIAPMGAPAPSGFGLTLVAIDGPLLGQRFPVNGPIEVGREGSGIRMAHDANASRRHASVSPGVGSVTVQDLGSTNGTFVNGQRVNQATAGPGDLVKIGSTTFRVE